MDYEKLHKETLESLQVMVHEGKITENVAKGICSDFKLESEDERIRKTLMHIVKGACDKYGIKYQGKEITEEKLLSWIEKKGTENTAEMPKGEDYGIDGMYAAIDILTRTLGEVEGYQSDDGILEHECAISAVKALYERKHNGWTEEDSHIKGAIIEYLIDNNLTEWANWLNNTIMLGCDEPAEWSDENKNNIIHCQESLNYYYRSGMITIDEYNSAKNLLNSLITKTHWKPTIDQMYAIQTAVSHLDNTPYYEIKELKSLHEDLKKLGYEE